MPVGFKLLGGYQGSIWLCRLQVLLMSTCRCCGRVVVLKPKNSAHGCERQAGSQKSTSSASHHMHQLTFPEFEFNINVIRYLFLFYKITRSAYFRAAVWIEVSATVLHSRVHRRCNTHCQYHMLSLICY